MQVPKPSFKRRAPKKSKRGNFSKKVREQIQERDSGQCQQCGQPGHEIHHVKFKSQSGRGVYTNGLTVCSGCHRQIHDNNLLAQKWRNYFKDRYGPEYFKDGYDS